MADRIFERILNQTAAETDAKQQQQDPELRRRKAEVRCPVLCTLGLCVPLVLVPSHTCLPTRAA